MLAIGGLLVSIALLMLAVMAPLFRSSDPPRWTTRGWIGEVVTLAIVSTLALGLGYFGAGAISAWQNGPDYLDLALLAVVLFGSIVIWRGLNAHARPKAVEADASEYARAPESGQADSSGLVAPAEPVPVATAARPRPHKAA